MLGILDNVRQHTISVLHSVLSDTLLLASKSKMFHWNVTGANFIGLHQLFDEHYHALSEASDIIAERIRALDSLVFCNLQNIISKSVLEESCFQLSDIEMIQELLHDHEKILGILRESTSNLSESSDFATIDILNQRLYAHGKIIWVLKSLIK